MLEVRSSGDDEFASLGGAVPWVVWIDTAPTLAEVEGDLESKAFLGAPEVGVDVSPIDADSAGI